MKNLKILWFNWRCWLNPAMGGAEVFTYEVSKRLVKSGNDVTLFTADFPGSLKEEVVDGVKIVRAGGKYTVYFQAKKMYEKLFRKKDFNVVIDEINTVPFFTQKFVKNNEKVIALIHQLARDYWFYETPFPISYLGYYLLEDYWLKQYVKVPTVTVSESTRKDLIGLGFKNISVIPEGLNTEPLKSLPEKENKPIIVFVGRLKSTKRPDHAIKAFQSVKKKIPNSELWIIGDGPFRPELEHMACSGVKFFGHLNNYERREIIKKARVLVNPGLREGWGLNVIEANALGVPCVAYPVHGLRDSIQDGQTGLLVESESIQALAEKLVLILSDKILWNKLAENALNYSRAFNWDKVATEFQQVINENVFK